jgi:isopentenyl phosphate kinase
MGLLSLCTSAPREMMPPSHPRTCLRERKSFAAPLLAYLRCLNCLPIGHGDIIMALQARRSVVHDQLGKR